MTQEEYIVVVRLCRDGIRKTNLELNLARDMKGNKTGF